MRQFYLRNENNETFDLMDKDSFFNTPNGLGFSKDLVFLDFNLSRKLKNSKFAKKKITGEIVLKDYIKYEELVSYIFGSRELKLYYQPDGVAGAYIKVEINEIPKGELDQSGLLITQIEMEALSYWVREEESKVVELPSVIVTDVFPLTFPFKFSGSTAEGNAELPIAIVNNGHLPCPIKIKIYGNSNYPEWKLENQQGKLNLVVAAGQEVVVDSREDIFSVYSGQTDLSQYLEYTYQNMIYAPIGESTLTFKGVNKVEVTIYEQYTTV